MVEDDAGAETIGTVACIGNPIADKGHGEESYEQAFDLLGREGERYGFAVMDLTGGSFEESLANARQHAELYDALVVVGGDGMIALGANAIGGSGKPLGIVAVGSGNDFARGLELPVNRIETAVEGIVGAIACGTSLDADMGHVTGIGESASIDRYYAGMLSCGLDASINDRANHSHLPTGTMRYFAAVLVELAHMKRYGYRIKATLADGTTDERGIITPLLTIANSRHIGGGIEVSPYSCFSDGLLDLVWMDHVPNFGECAVAISNAYNGKLLASKVFGWKRIHEIEVTRAAEGDEPPVLMADGEYIGHLPFRVVAEDCALRVLVPPAVAAREVDSRQEVLDVIARDGRDPVTGQFA